MHRKVLLLDDSPERANQCRDALASIPEPSYSLVEAAFISEALASLESDRPACVLIAWVSPGTAALAALHRIRNRQPATPIVMLAGADELSYRLDALKATGDCHVLRAPLTPQALHGAIDHAIREGDGRRVRAGIGARSHIVLVIDDNPDDRELCRRWLARADERLQVMEAEGGEAGLALIEEAAPDCVLLDYSLPGMSGLAILQRIQGIDPFLPVIIMTGQGDEGIAVDAIKGGAQNYLVKSTANSERLHQAVMTAIEHAELERQVTQQREQLYEQKIALAENSRLMSAVLDSAPCMILVTDTDGKVMVFNKELERVLGYSADEVVGKHTPRLWSRAGPIVERAEAFARENAAASGERSASDVIAEFSPAKERTFIRKDGGEVPVSLWARDLYNSEGQIIGFLGMGEDITERKARREALQTSEETFRSAMEHAPCGMALIDPDGRFLKVNRALCELVGLDAAGLCLTTLPALCHPEDAAIDKAQRSGLLAGEHSASTAEMRLVDQVGAAVDVQVNLSLVRSAGDRPKYFVAQIQDIRERKEIDRLKNQFIAVFSHELRTPLTSIRGSIGLLSAPTFQDKPALTEHLLGIAHRNCEKLIGLVNDILDVSRLEARHMHFDMKPLALDQLMRDAVEANRSLAESQQVRMKLILPADVVVTVDGARFVQALSNLVCNAAKFSPAGSEACIAATYDGGRARVSVTDCGPGISERFRPHLFKKFSQLDSSSTRPAGGYGLGLYISKELTEHMGGRIGVETAEGAGSTFWIELPAECESQVGPIAGRLAR